MVRNTEEKLGRRMTADEIFHMAQRYADIVQGLREIAERRG